jgi:hypothetical protein
MSTSSVEMPVTPDLSRQRLATGLIIALVLCIGIAARLRAVQLSTGLFRDDAALATSILTRDERELMTKPLIDHQVAPIGYVLLSKELVRWLGPGDTVLRLPALVASILTLVVYLILARQVLSPDGQVFGLALMSFSMPLISFAARAKPYSSDVFVAVVLLTAGIWAMRRPPTLVSYLALAALGALAAVFSLPAVFVLGGVGLVLIFHSAAAGRVRESIGWIAVSALWLAVFLISYFLFHRQHSNTLMSNWFEDFAGFAPFPPRSIGHLKWYYNKFFELFQVPVGVEFGDLAAVLYLFGAYLIATRVNRRVLAMLIIPLILALAASALKKYPFSDRLVLYTCPLLVTVVAAGIAGVSRTETTTRLLRRLMAVVLLIYPTYMTLTTLRSGTYSIHDVKPALDYLADHYQEGDVVYMHCGAEMLYNYYANILNYKNLREKPTVIGIDPDNNKLSVGGDLAVYGKDLERVQGQKRVWFVFVMSATKYVPMFEYILDARGAQLDKFQDPGSTILLYGLGGSDRKAPGPGAIAP